MHPTPSRLRRARRTDFVAVMRIVAGSGFPVPPPDRAVLRRFRRIVADLGSDFYVAVVGEKVVGFVHVTYARQIVSGARARVEALAVDRDHLSRGIGSSLLELACRRARQRACAELSCEVADADSSFRAFLIAGGWSGGEQVLRMGRCADAPSPPSMQEG